LTILVCMLVSSIQVLDDVRGDVLNQALPYIQKFQGQIFVVKYGGSAMRSFETMRSVIRNVLLLHTVGIRVVLVHGGGPEIDVWLNKLGHEKVVIDGLRVTDDVTMEVVEMALAGRANKALVAEIQLAGGQAVGLSGRDADTFIAAPISEELGRVGTITHVHTELVETLITSGFIPVVCSVAHDLERQPLNINADTAAAALASSLCASKLILLTDTAGILQDRNDATSTIAQLTTAEASDMIEKKAADGGMIPKIQAGIEALNKGVKSVHLINGSTPNSLLLEVFTDGGVGTMLVL
jgi:acetylglutamate kinase